MTAPTYDTTGYRFGGGLAPLIDTPKVRITAYCSERERGGLLFVHSFGSTQTEAVDRAVAMLDREYGGEWNCDYVEEWS